METFLIVWLIVHFTLVLGAFIAMCFTPFRKEWRDIRSIAFVCAFPALVLTIWFLSKRYPHGWIL